MFREEPGGDGTDAAPVEVAVVGSRIEADLILGLLLAHGLDASVATDDAGGAEPQWQLSGVRVLVAASDADSAQELLAGLEAESQPEG